MIAYIFDVYGTLTPSRGQIDKAFLKWFYRFSQENNVFFATGSDASKTIEQTGKMLFNSINRSYNCAGNSVWEKGVEVRRSEWSLSKTAMNWLEEELEHALYNIRTGQHIDIRPGLVNFSVVGRGATPEQREDYVLYDRHTNERNLIAKRFNEQFKHENVEAQVAGETGLDIMPIGKGKQQILEDFSNDDVIHFFGDRTEPGGNDFDIAEDVKARGWGIVYPVSSWEDTWTILKSH